MTTIRSLSKDQVRELLVLLWQGVKVRPGATLIFAVFQLATVFTTLAQPTLNAAIIDDGILRGDIDAIRRIGLIMLGVAILNLVVALGATYTASHISSATARDLRARVNGHMASFTDPQVNRIGLSSLLTRSSGDVGQIQGFLFISLTIVVTAPLMLFGALILSLAQGWRMTPVIIVAGAILLGLVTLLVRRLLPWAAELQRRIDGMNRLLREQLRGIALIRTFRREDLERERFADENAELTDISLKLGRLQVLMLPTITIIANIAVVVVTAAGAVFIDRGQMQIGQIASTVGYLTQILLAVSMLTIIAGLIPRAVTSAGRITEVLETEVLEAGDPGSAEPADPPTLAFASVSFGHPDAESNTVDDLSLTVERGSITGIIGGTGSGKSTVLSLPLRFADATAGKVTWNGVETITLAPAWLRARSAFVGQGAGLISGTVADNLRIGRPEATDDDLWVALEVASASEFIRARTEGLQAPVSQEGRNFSGGQRQRLALARAFLRRPALYILDDPFSALDVDTEAAIIEQMRSFHPEASVLIAAQRVSSVRHADEIVVLDEGRIVATGTDETLRETSDIYRDIAYAQSVTNA